MTKMRCALCCLAVLVLSACGSNASNASRDADAALAAATPPEEVAEAPSAEELMKDVPAEEPSAATPEEAAAPEAAAASEEREAPKGAETSEEEAKAPAAPKVEEQKKPKADPLAAEKKVSDKIDGKVSGAIRDAQGGKLEDAVSTLEKLVDEPEGGYLAAYNLGVLKERQGKYDQAAQAYIKSLGQNPSFSPALQNVVRIYLRKGATRDAREVASTFSERRPQVLGHRVALLEVELAEGKYEDVIRQAKEVLRKDERNVDAMMALADANYELERYELSRSVLSVASKVTPGRADIYYRFGLVELKLEAPVKARANFEKAVELRPNYPEAHNNLGVLLHEVRDFEKAAEHFKFAVRDYPDFKQAYLNLGNAYKGLQKFKEAEGAFEQAVKIDDRYADAYFNLGVMYLDSQVPGLETIPRLQKAVETLGKYKEVAGRLSKKDPADKYIAEAKKAIQTEKDRQELMRETQMGGDDGFGEDEMGDDGFGDDGGEG